MSNLSGRTSANVFYQARCEAAKHNDALSSREGAAEAMAIDRGRIYRIESGIATPYPDEVRLMSDLYGAPELENHYCTHMCPLGTDIPDAAPASLEQLALRMLMALRNVGEVGDRMVEIAADGVVDEGQEDDMREVAQMMRELEGISRALRMLFKKMMREEGRTR